MSVFKDCSVVLDLKKVPYKEKKKLTSAVLDNGGQIVYVLTQKCTFVVTSSLEDLSTNRQRSAEKHHIPVVGLQFVWSCLEKGFLLPVNEHILKPQQTDLTHQPHPHPGLKSRGQPQAQNIDNKTVRTEPQVKGNTYLGKSRVYKHNDCDIPEFPAHFQVAKYSIFYKAETKTWSVLELQCARGKAGQHYCVVNSVMNEREKTIVKEKQMYSSSSEEAVDVYLMWQDELNKSDFTSARTLPPVAQKLASHGLQQLFLEEKLNCSTVSQEVGAFVELIWTEALGSLSNILTVPVSSISLNDVSKVEGLLLQVQKCVSEEEVKALLEEVNTLLPLRMKEPDSKQKLVSQKLDLCQVIRDILNMTEATLGNPSPSSLGKYRALRCSIEPVPSQSPEFQSVCQLLQDMPMQIHHILYVNRASELHLFKEELGNVKPLLHSSSPSSFVGILSRGLLLPRFGVEQHGIERTDVGNLGSGIYFSDSLSTSVKYSKPSATDGTRLLLVCDVALGQCKNLNKRDTTLTCAPEGYHSVHGVHRTQTTHSDFEDDEYVVYNTDQVRLKYVVQFSLKQDQLKTFQPHIDKSVELTNSLLTSDLLPFDDNDGFEVTKNPLDGVTAGLLNSSGQTLPLKSVHVRCKLMDLLSQVIIFQTYTNDSTISIEAKYVFPLEETAAVCGFEAFINGKHVIGKVKEKEQARREYRQAVEKGHGAYLMDQDAPDVFTISVGNLPPGATVLIKVTFITEMVVRASRILFSLPGSVAPWQQSAALNQRTQTTVEKVCVKELESEGEFSLCMSIEMPFEIIDLECSHLIKTKRTDCKAVVSTLPKQTLSADGFRLSFTLSQIHMPRMWVEKHPEKESEACMLVFYPDFESSGVSASGVSDVVILLDTSESMRGEAMVNARRIAVNVLHSLDRALRANIITFGTDFKEAFHSPNALKNMDVFKSAKKFIMTSPAVGGSTELWRPLRSLNLLPPTHGIRNVLLLSDGHVQNQPQTLQLVRENTHHTRLFTCGLSPTANRHMLRALAQAGGGAYEFFDTKTKHTWAEKVKSQVKCMASPGCSSVAVKWQQFNPRAPPPVQAPSQLHALFSDCHTLVYGFVPHCTQATLFGDLSGQELQTVVSTTELQKTKGTFLHKLTARAIIRDFEDGSLGSSEAEHEGKKMELKSYVIELSKEFSILSQFTSFVAIEERDKEQPESGITDVPKIIAEEDVDVLPYMGWTEEKQMSLEEEEEDVLYGMSYDWAFDAEIRSDSAESWSDIDSSIPKMGLFMQRELEDGLDVYDDVEISACNEQIALISEYDSGSAIAIAPDSHSISGVHEVSEIRCRKNTMRFALGIASPPPPPPPPIITKDPIEPILTAIESTCSPLHRSQSVPHPVLCSPLPCSDMTFAAVKVKPTIFECSPSFSFAASPSCLNSTCRPLSSGSPLSVTELPPCPPGTIGHDVQSFPLPPILNSATTSFAEFCASPIAPDPINISASPPILPRLLRLRQYERASMFSDCYSDSESRFHRVSSPDMAFPSVPATKCLKSKTQGFFPRLGDPPQSSHFESMHDASLKSLSYYCGRRRRQAARTVKPAPVPVGKSGHNLLECDSVCKQYTRPDMINWEELFDLQHQDGYWECTAELSRFLGLDVDFFANVFLKEKGICSLGVKASADILRLVATLLVLQLMRVMKMTEGELFQSLFRLTDSFSFSSRLPCYEVVKRAVDWACWADRQYPCVCSRLEIGRDWESCTRQLLGVDSLPPCSPLTSILQKSTEVPVQ
ncbi:protein mono-ADP-ribosyltransferase PARP4-like isoform X2 [Hoplias malabaricus]|uniref:protein mono-ADP-ribosyltransferase PARP4-like isoform X2 n=1 Tax=Hoplias malabaricus TaxID=27720 RepID=UPI003462AC9E